MLEHLPVIAAYIVAVIGGPLTALFILAKIP